MAAPIGGRSLGSCSKERIGEQASERCPLFEQRFEAAEALAAQFEELKNENVARSPQGMPGVEALDGRRRSAGMDNRACPATEQGRGEQRQRGRVS